MRKQNIKISIICDVPDEEDAVIAGFIIDALERWGGQGHPDDPLFHSLSVKSVAMRGAKYTNLNPTEI